MTSHKSVQPPVAHAGRVTEADTKLRICFVLPEISALPVGGHQVVINYANRLAERGYLCTVMMPFFGCVNPWGPPATRALRRGQLIKMLMTRGDVRWAEWHPDVRLRTPLIAHTWNLPPADVTVATGWQTAHLVASSGHRSGAKAYLVQSYETWQATHNPAIVRDTWRLPMTKIVIARWLLDLADEFGEISRTHYVPNGVDLNQFRVVSDISARNPCAVGMLVHDAELKGTALGFDALERVRERFNDIDIRLYGATAPSTPLPAGASYRQNITGADLRNYFNGLAIFVHPSLIEGWPLPPAEAMACGAALLTADNPGVLDYARAEANAVVVPRGSAEALAEGIGSLIANPRRRIDLAQAAHRDIQSYGMDVAADRFESILRTICDTQRDLGHNVDQRSD